MVNRGRPNKPIIQAAPEPLNGAGDGFTIDWLSS
jgi:hypothetical protein